MEKYLEIISKLKLFNDVEHGDLKAILGCLGSRLKDYKKGEYIISEQDSLQNIGILLKGSAHIINEDAFGRETIVTMLEQADMFGEALVCAGVEKSPFSILAMEDCTVLFINYSRIVNVCSNSCSFHGILIQNMLKIIASKNILLNKKLFFTSKKGIREKLSAFLLDQCEQANAKSFEIPFSREELASYLSVDRSAMSRELCRMRDEELISFNKNKFKILKSI